jgi:uncharacterized protein (DUF433 family)
MAAAQNEEIVPGVAVNPAIGGGTPVIAGTRVPVKVVLGHLASGDSEAAVMAEYDLTEAQIGAAFGYAAHVVASERVYVVATE